MAILNINISSTKSNPCKSLCCLLSQPGRDENKVAGKEGGIFGKGGIGLFFFGVVEHPRFETVLKNSSHRHRRDSNSRSPVY